MKFILDENFSYRIADVLRILFETDPRVFEIQHIAKDLNYGGTPDPVWLASLPNNEQNVLLTKDYRIAKRPHEKAAWRKSGVITFFFRNGWFHTKGEQQASVMIMWWPTIIEMAMGSQSGDVYSIPFNFRPKRLNPL